MTPITIFFLLCCTLVASSVITVASEFNERFIKSRSFVDKSELLVELFRPRYGEHALVTFPPKFGKTTNLRMLKKLLQIELDFNYKSKPKIRTSAHHLLQNLKLAKQEELCTEHVAQHPVILLDLKYDVEGNITHDKLVAGLKDKIRQIFEEYQWLGEKLTEDLFQYGPFFQNTLRGELSEREVLDSLHVLSKILYKYFNESKVVFLVDDFDYVSKYDFVEPNVTDDLYFMIHSIILNVTKTPYCTKRSLILSVSDRKVGTPLYGNLRQFPFLEEDTYSPFFGIHSAELDKLFEKYQCSEEEKTDVKKWYAGYETNLVFRPVYNTYSIMEYFRHRNEIDALRPYWASVQDTTFIKQFLRVPSFRASYIELLRYGSICYKFRKRRLLAEKKFLSNITKDNKDVAFRQDRVKDMIGLLFEQGYLCHKNYMRQGSFKIPNLEIEILLLSEAAQFYQRHGISVADISEDLINVLNEEGSSADFLLSANFQANVLSKMEPMKKAVFQTSIELEFFNLVQLALSHIKLTKPGIEIIMNLITSTGRDDMILVSETKAMLININPNPNRIMPEDQYMCRYIQNRNITTIRLLGLSIFGSGKVTCFVRTVNCDSILHSTST